MNRCDCGLVHARKLYPNCATRGMRGGGNVGRPPLDPSSPSVRWTLTTTQKVRDELDKVAETRGLTRGDLVRLALAEWLEQSDPNC